MIKIEQLYYLTQVAKYNSIHKAAEKLYMTSAAVSSAMKQLEKECGYAILERTYRGVRLTEDGKYVLKIAEQILSLCDSLQNVNEKSENEVVKTNLVLTTTISRFLSKRLVGSSSKVLQYFNLLEENKNLEEICQQLSKGTIALVMIDEKENQRLQTGGEIVSTVLYRSKMYPVSSKNTKFIAPNQKRISNTEFAKLPQVVMGGTEREKGTNVVLHTENSTLYAEAILNDYGVGLLAKFAPDLFEVDYRMFRIYEPFSDNEKVITILSKIGCAEDKVQHLKQLLTSQ